jgi:hypothetical protein
MYGLVNPSILICLLPVTASEKFTSIDGFVSKLSDKLQQAAFCNSPCDKCCVLVTAFCFLPNVFCFFTIVTVAILLSEAVFSN